MTLPFARVWAFLRGIAGLLRHGQVRLTALEEALGRLEHRFAKIENLFADWHAQLASVAEVLSGKASMVDLLRQTQQLRDRLAAMDGQAAQPTPSHADGATGSPQPSGAGETPLEQAFYLALESQFRGTEQQIGDRLGVYRPWLADLPSGVVADLGCGRGEWLALLADWGISAVGVDSNPLNVAALQAIGRQAVCADALDWLQHQPAHSCAAITAFHLVEHLPFGTLLQLVDAARRALKPGGCLIFETPNPENLDVSMCSFWLDPTHRRPLPPHLLEFVVAYCGLIVEDVPRLNPPEVAEGDRPLGARLGVGRDFAVIGRRPHAAPAPRACTNPDHIDLPAGGA
jgi:O-antigen chain-terminating methyltransferase